MKAAAKKAGNHKPGIKSDLLKSIRELAPEDQREVADLVEFLQSKRKKRLKKGCMTFSWEGALAHLKDQYSSVELQHELSKRWGKP